MNIVAISVVTVKSTDVITLPYQSELTTILSDVTCIQRYTTSLLPSLCHFPTLFLLLSVSLTLSLALSLSLYIIYTF